MIVAAGGRFMDFKFIKCSRSVTVKCYDIFCNALACRCFGSKLSSSISTITICSSVLSTRQYSNFPIKHLVADDCRNNGIIACNYLWVVKLFICVY